MRLERGSEAFSQPGVRQRKPTREAAKVEISYPERWGANSSIRHSCSGRATVDSWEGSFGSRMEGQGDGRFPLAMELDRVANQSPGSPDFWEVIKAVEFWERQHAALLNQGDPMSAIRRSSAGAAVLLGDPGVAGKEPSVVCTWCSQRGHLENTCIRDPRWARCFGPHPERNHDAIVMADQAYFQLTQGDGWETRHAW